MRWLYVTGGVAALAASAWYFGQPKSTATNATTVAPTVVVAATEETPTKPKDIEPLKLIEVIDLTRGYEPAPEETLPVQGVLPSTLISLPTANERMPSAKGERWETIEIAPRVVLVETLTIPPRDITPRIIEINDDPLNLLTPKK